MRPFIIFLSKWPQSWVQLRGATWSSNRQVMLDFVVRAHRRGSVVGRWSVRAVGVKEFQLSDVDGGGLSLTGGQHPVLRQYVDPTATLHLKASVTEVPAVLAALWAEHVALVADWIAPERYLGTPEQLKTRLLRHRGIVCRGPAFLVRRYARVLVQHGVASSVSASRSRVSRSAPLRLLHFGHSFVVATSFTSGRAG